MRCPATSRTCPGSNGSIILWSPAMRRIQRSDLIIPPPGVASGVLYHDVRELGRHVAPELGDPHCDAARDPAIGLRRRALRVGRDRRVPGVGLFSDADVERQLAEQLRAVIAAHLL